MCEIASLNRGIVVENDKAGPLILQCDHPNVS